MNKVYCKSGVITNNFGSDPGVHWNRALDMQSSLHPRILANGFDTYASFLREDQWDLYRDVYGDQYTKAALLCIESIQKAVKDHDVDWQQAMIILATTKGDIDLYAPDAGADHNDKAFPATIAHQLDRFFRPGSPTLVLSNACISGSQAVQLGASMIRSGRVRDVIVCGVDLLTEFTLAGFNSLKALSSMPCKPFDAGRDGISLGEAGAALLLSSQAASYNNMTTIECVTGTVTNDANHISGPSRTGEGLYQAIKKVTDDFREKVDTVSLHGTATIFNDDMESIALQRAGLDNTESFGLKGIYGHTLGAAGVLECVLGLYAMCHNTIPATVGCERPGTAAPIHISQYNIMKPVNTLLKCASGFGGGNCALLFKKTGL